MDRTHWEFGKTTINILMISLIWNGMGIPLIWTLLPSAGNSNTRARTELLDHLRETFADLKIASLMGDREFIGDAWMTYLSNRKIPFILRLRENQHVVREGFATWTITDIARRLDKGQKMVLKGWCRLGQGAGEGSPRLRIVVMRLPTNELLALACSSKPHHALASYRQRWTIETMFANLKTKGFNLEDTHITDPDKLSTLLAVLALSVTICAKTGVAAARLHPIPIKKHGRRAWSLFALGLGALHKIAASANPAEIIGFLRQLLSSKLPANQLKSWSSDRESSTMHSINIKHVPRYLAEFEYRFNRRYDLAAMLPRLTWAGVRTPPMPYHLLKLAEVYPDSVRIRDGLAMGRGMDSDWRHEEAWISGR